ncbi:YeeE/YedE family protein [Erythrobacter litoralis]|uniref:DUF6691 family protein n=1 Tax=Erythrobacter litoralis TaxID=39960 RepID=UPI00243586B8|nr:DUF6691 family protein [Erythrobacter litoralis]MDG6078788.1 YeeE/YedE family protein [Erythrobacter litoralis]
MRTGYPILAGLLFGAGLAISGMLDPARVRAFLDVFGDWDPTLAFVMGGALIVMAAAWAVQRRMNTSLAGTNFDLPDTTTIDTRLVGGAAMFGIGWGIAGLCPGPAVASLGTAIGPAAIFVVSMAMGVALQRVLVR